MSSSKRHREPDRDDVRVGFAEDIAARVEDALELRAQRVDLGERERDAESPIGARGSDVLSQAPPELLRSLDEVQAAIARGERRVPSAFSTGKEPK